MDFQQNAEKHSESKKLLALCLSYKTLS